MDGGAAAASIAHAVKEDKRGSDSSHEDEPCKEEKTSLKTRIATDHEEGNSKLSSSSSHDQMKDFKGVKQIPTVEKSSVGQNSGASGPTNKDQDDELESAKAEMGEVMQENQRLKSYLDQIMKDYHALQMKFYDMIRQESKTQTNATTTAANKNTVPREMEEAELVSLTLGRSSSIDSKNKNITTKNNNSEEGKGG
ncbi:hypothetical protein Ancab_038917 [Ancistrocladus abbreviatus]